MECIGVVAQPGAELLLPHPAEVAVIAPLTITIRAPSVSLRELSANSAVGLDDLPRVYGARQVWKRDVSFCPKRLLEPPPVSPLRSSVSPPLSLVFGCSAISATA